MILIGEGIIVNFFALILFQLDEASEIVKDEIHRLDHNADDAFEKINVQFQAILDGVSVSNSYRDMPFGGK